MEPMGMTPLNNTHGTSCGKMHATLSKVQQFKLEIPQPQKALYGPGEKYHFVFPLGFPSCPCLTYHPNPISKLTPLHETGRNLDRKKLAVAPPSKEEINLHSQTFKTLLETVFKAPPKLSLLT